MDKILEIFPVESHLLVAELLKLPLHSKQQLLTKLDSYSAIVDKEAATKPDLDVNLAECLSRGGVALIDEIWDEATVQQRKLIQVACDYFIIENDEDGDFNSVFGFDDDARVFNVVAEYLNRDNLLIQV
jgi:hypothetical protein